MPEQVRATFTILKPEYERMQQSIEMLESKREEDVLTWNTTLDKEIQGFGDRIKDMRTQAQDPQIKSRSCA